MWMSTHGLTSRPEGSPPNGFPGGLGIADREIALVIATI